MAHELIKRREEILDRVDRALDAAWPARTGDAYVREMRWAERELKAVAIEMQSKGIGKVEQSRTYQGLGSVYADLEPALGKEMLLKAMEAYNIAETLIEGQSEDLVRAKLNFNIANTLRLLDPNDIRQLQQAKQRLQAARTYFAKNAPQFLEQVDAASQSVESLLKIAPLANVVIQNTNDMATLQEKLSAGDNVGEIAERMQDIMKRDGGAAGLVGQLQAVVDELPADQKQSDKFAQVQKQMEQLTKVVLKGTPMNSEDESIWSLLVERLKSDSDGGKVSKERAESLDGIMVEFARILSGDEEDVQALLDKTQRLEEFAKSKFEMTHYLSHGVNRPPEDSRAACLVELNWQLRRYLLEEMSRAEKGEDESKEALDLNIRATRIDRRIYEAGADNTLAMTVEKEELRPLALAVRYFSARMYTMPAKPIWRSANIPVDTNAIFYAGSPDGNMAVSVACRRSGLEIMSTPRGESFANARWKQLQKSVIAVFDLRLTDNIDMASVIYELGIALTIGKPIVLLVSEGQTMPFNVDIFPVVLTGKPNDNATLAIAIDRAMVWTYPRPRQDASSRTLEHVITRYPRPQQNVYVDQTVRQLTELRNKHDPLAVRRTLAKLYDYLKDGETMLLQPWWLPVYPDESRFRLFHVMPFRPKWANKVTEVTRMISEAAGVMYVRGDEVDDPNVIHSIWEEIARATHVLVDLTGFNANVALELGIAHTLGKKVLMVGQGDTVDKLDKLFPSVSKLRFHKYSMKRLEQTLGCEIESFVSS